VTRGVMVVQGTVQYIVAYRFSEADTNITTDDAGDFVIATITDDTTLRLCLLDLTTVGALLDIAPFTPAWITEVNTRRGGLTDVLNQANRQAKESTLMANLQRIRSAIAAFQADTGVYPARLQDLVATTAPREGGGGATIPTGSYKGPYLTTVGGINNTGLPANPFNKADDADITHHWRYDPREGSVISAIEGMTLDGRKYITL
jgi:hypothetical protein